MKSATSKTFDFKKLNFFDWNSFYSIFFLNCAGALKIILHDDDFDLGGNHNRINISSVNKTFKVITDQFLQTWTSYDSSRVCYTFSTNYSLWPIFAYFLSLLKLDLCQSIFERQFPVTCVNISENSPILLFFNFHL